MNLFPLDYDNGALAAELLNNAHVKCSQNELIQLFGGIANTFTDTQLFKIDGSTVKTIHAHANLFRGWASPNKFAYALDYWDSCYSILRRNGLNYCPMKHGNYLQQLHTIHDKLVELDLPDKHVLYMDDDIRYIALQMCGNWDDADHTVSTEPLRFVPTSKHQTLLYRLYYARAKTVLDKPDFTYTYNDIPDWLIPMMQEYRDDVDITD